MTEQQEAPRVLPRVLIVGYGNPLRSDDGLGPTVADALAQIDWAARGLDATVVAYQQPVPELSALLADVERAIFIDASVPGEPATPGRVRCQMVAPDQSAAPSLTHHMPPSVLLAWSALVYGSAPLAWVVSVEAASFAYGSGLSPTVRAALPHLHAQVLALLRPVAR